MKDEKFRETVSRILDHDSRYAAEAYAFVSDAVNYTAEKLNRRNKSSRHISGHELLEGITDYALKQFGPLACEVLSEWGLENGLSIGNVVFNMVNEKLLTANENDSIEDFSVDFDITEELRRPFEQAPPNRKIKPPIIA